MANQFSKSVAIDTVPLPERVVQVTIPHSVAINLKAFQKAQASILDKLGCPACCSGFDIRFDTIRSFSVDNELNIRELVGGGIVTNG
ncbi:MAG: hypothetical protein GKR91_08560 [Pseudomonadales bacterium]|nr:hypothetical protein [Pseudomonadales bacterium]